MDLDVEDIATDQDLIDRLAGTSNLQDILPDDWLDQSGNKTAKPARLAILGDVLKALTRRRPPVREADLLDPTELKDAVCFGALEMLFLNAASYENSPYPKKQKYWGDKYKSEVLALAPETRLGVTTSSLTARLSRG